MFFFSKKKRAKRSLVDIANRLQDISNRYKGFGLDAVVRKISLDIDYHPQWKNLDSKITKLIAKLKYSLNDGNTITVQTVLRYLEKLIDSRIGFSNYFDQLKDPVEEQLQEYDILMSEYLDKADKAMSSLEKEPLKQDIHEFDYKSAVIESKRIANIMLDLSTRVRKADLERDKKIYDTQNVSEDIKKKSELSAFYKEQESSATAENIRLNQRRYRNFEDVEIPSGKAVASLVKSEPEKEGVKRKTIIKEE